ncbi:Photosystem I assembly protein Ycf3 [Kordia antarctica]|uniref:Photosystem I assembly protein Ycf3 n=1 Tax=Kordia antarctica TaxID=1218801 RepID=A0A7L4ZSK5_9FLAO|nr:hypothetical protein [Kordia antarctica]QHI39340.1 Photosystem I assembly protein Ycf3 [Kordia antarctica]
MKTVTTVFVTTFCVLFSFVLNSQNDCTNTLSLFNENVKTKRFTEALPQLAYLRENCATFHSAIYARGETLLEHELNQATDKENAALALIQLYKDRIKNVPLKTKKGTILSKIGAVMIDYSIGSITAQYAVFDEAFQTDQKNFKHPTYLYRYFELYYKMYIDGNHGISLENLIEKQEVVATKFTFEKERSLKIKNDGKSSKKVDWATKNIEAIDTFLNNMNLLIEKEATCETLIPMYQKKFEVNKNKLDWMKKSASTLDAKGCENDALFIELVETIDALEPSAKTKFFLYKFHVSKGNSAKANVYLAQYLDMETDDSKRATVLTNLGNEAAKNGQKSKARNYFLDVLKIDASSGKTYLSIARLYGSSANECGSDEFTKRATYWKAAEMARKAVNIDASVKNEATELIHFYMESAPSKTLIFDKTYTGGEKIPMKCWIGGNAIVPKL